MRIIKSARAITLSITLGFWVSSAPAMDPGVHMVKIRGSACAALDENTQGLRALGRFTVTSEVGLVSCALPKLTPRRWFPAIMTQVYVYYVMPPDAAQDGGLVYDPYHNEVFGPERGGYGCVLDGRLPTWYPSLGEPWTGDVRGLTADDWPVMTTAVWQVEYAHHVGQHLVCRLPKNAYILDVHAESKSSFP